MTTELMIDGFDHSFELSPEASTKVLALIEGDRLRGWLRSSLESGVTDAQALERFRIACSALHELSPRLRQDGDARRAVAHTHLVRFRRTLRELRDGIIGVQQAIGDDTYDQMPPAALSALEAVSGGRTKPWRSHLTFADLVFDPLNWQSRATQLAVTLEWIDDLTPLVDEAAISFGSPGRTRGSAGRVAGSEVLDLLRLLDRSETGEVRRPSRRQLRAWLDLLFEVTAEDRPQSTEVLAKNVLSDRFSKDRADWRHPPLPEQHGGRDLLVCTIDSTGQRRWSGMLVDRLGQEETDQ